MTTYTLQILGLRFEEDHDDLVREGLWASRSWPISGCNRSISSKV